MKLFFSVIIACALSSCVATYAPISPEAHMKALELIDQGTVQLRVGDLEAARAAFHLARELADLPQALDGLGTVAFQEGNATLAEAYFVEALELDPQYSEAASNLALLYESAGMREQALDLYQHALRADPQNFRARNNFAALLADYGKEAGKSRREKGLAQLIARDELEKARTLASHPVIMQNRERLRRHERQN